MRFGIIGAGKLGCALAIGLRNKDFEISGIFSRSEDSARYLCDRLDMEPVNSLKHAMEGEVVFITVPDGHIGSAAEAAAKASGASGLHGKTFLHCSGALGSDNLQVLKSLGADIGSFHPIQTFADRDRSWEGLEGICFGFEGSIGAKKKAELIAAAFGGHMLTIPIENKPLYHAAACILSNYTVTLSYMAGKLFDNIGIDAATGVRAFMPLVKKTVDNIESLGALKALTGPISRGDHSVVAKHLKDMEAKAPETAVIYRALGKMTVEAALEKGSIDMEKANKLFELL